MYREIEAILAEATEKLKDLGLPVVYWSITDSYNDNEQPDPRSLTFYLNGSDKVNQF